MKVSVRLLSPRLLPLNTLWLLSLFVQPLCTPWVAVCVCVPPLRFFCAPALSNHPLKAILYLLFITLSHQARQTAPTHEILLIFFPLEIVDELLMTFAMVFVRLFGLVLFSLAPFLFKYEPPPYETVQCYCQLLFSNVVL